MRIGVLGCGWLGLPLAKSLMDEGYEINGSTTRQEKIQSLEKEGIKPYQIIIKEDQIEGDIKGFLDCEILIIDFPPKRNENVTDLYPSQVNHLKDELINSKVKKVLFISSTSVYPSPDGLINEETALNPIRKSGKALIEAENIITSAQEYFKSTIIRFAGLIGPQRNPGRFLAGKENLSGPDAPVNLIHLEDCIAIIKAILKEGKWGEVFNGASPDHPSKKEYYTLAATKMNLPVPHFDPEKQTSYKIVDGSKAERLLNFRYVHRDLIKSLKEM